MKKILLLSLSLLSLTAMTQTIPTDHLMGWYTFSGNANDLSSNNYDGTAYGATLSYGRDCTPNSAYSFNGTSNYISLPSTFDYSPRTVSLWFYAATIDNTLRDIYASDNNNLVNGLTNIRLQEFNDTARIYCYIGNLWDTVNITANEWHHVLLDISDSSAEIYLDCDLIDTTTSVSYLHSVNGVENTILGSSRTHANQYFNGRIDDVRIYNRLLTQGEITSLCQEGLGIRDIPIQNSVSIFPNPSSGIISVHIGEFTTIKDVTLKITDCMGQTMRMYSITQQTTNINLSEYSKGIYFVHIIDAQSNTIDIRKIVLQ